jgi:hypothetical protein
MNRVLSWPHTAIVPGLLEALQHDKNKTVVTEKETVRFDLLRGPVEMKFSSAQQRLRPGTEVYVWWKGGGFVCAPSAEVEAEENESRRIAERVRQARSQLQAARREREARVAARVDVVIPLASDPDPRSLLRF